jgi:hypothetical protein
MLTVTMDDGAHQVSSKGSIYHISGVVTYVLKGNDYTKQGEHTTS